MLITEKLGLILQTFTKWGKLNSEENLYFLRRKWTEELNFGNLFDNCNQKLLLVSDISVDWKYINFNKFLFNYCQN